MLTQSRLKKLLHYKPETGVFIWLFSTSKRVKAGDVAGTFESNGYIRIGIGGKRYLAHRLAFLYMKGRWPTHQMDHFDHVRHNNRWLNLREATNKENQRNKTMRRDNTSGYMGVSWHNPTSTWRVRISVEGKQIHLGRFTDVEDAIAARKAANIKHDYHPNHGK